MKFLVALLLLLSMSAMSDLMTNNSNPEYGEDIIYTRGNLAHNCSKRLVESDFAIQAIVSESGGVIDQPSL